MMKYLVILIFTIVYSFALDELAAQKQNTLYVQNLIEIEENIAKNLEKYILTEFKLPTMANLVSDGYFGTNFSLKNNMGDDIDFKSINDLQVKYAIKKAEYRQKRDGNIGVENYIVQLYNRDLYRDYTSVYNDVDISKSYIELKLKSPEAQNIFNLLKTGNTIAKECGISLVNTYCNNDSKTIRWYNSTSNWIEYSKKEFNKGNIIISNESIITSDVAKLRGLSVGSYVFIKDKTKNVKLTDLSGNLQILKVD